MEARPRRFLLLTGTVALVLALLLVLATRQEVGRATSGGSPYETVPVTDTNPAGNVVETTIVADEATVDVNLPRMANMETYNGAVPGPTFHLSVGDTVIVHYENKLDHASAIHWHGIELANAVDGTTFTQNQVEPGGTFLYKFQVTRPGLFWYHPHHHASTNQVFKGLYGMIVVEDPNEAAAHRRRRHPARLADAASSSSATRRSARRRGPTTPRRTTRTRPTDPWVGGANLPTQADPTPVTLCETPTAIDDDGALKAQSYDEGDVPANQTAGALRADERGPDRPHQRQERRRPRGQPDAPGALAGNAETMSVQAGQGLRLQILNAAVDALLPPAPDARARRRPCRSRSSASAARAACSTRRIQEGGTPGRVRHAVHAGEILFTPGTRSDVVAAIPAAATGTLTLWTRGLPADGQRLLEHPDGPGRALHRQRRGVRQTTSRRYDPLRDATGDHGRGPGPAATDTAQPRRVRAGQARRLARRTMELQALANDELRVDGVFGTHDVAVDYTLADHLGSTRYAVSGETLPALGVQQHRRQPPVPPARLLDPAARPDRPGGDADASPTRRTTASSATTSTIKAGYTLNFRVRIDPRPLTDGTTSGGELGRWVFHCHIFFHATNGMLSELVVVDGDGNERPNIDTRPRRHGRVKQGDTATVTGKLRTTSTAIPCHAERERRDGDRRSAAGNGRGAIRRRSTTSRFVYVDATDADGPQLPGAVLHEDHQRGAVDQRRARRR